MAYQRVLPRDLFNEADLLKCIGRLWILLDERKLDHSAEIEEERVDAFEIVQDPGSGGISVQNLTFTVKGKKYRLERPLNTREKWPLWVEQCYDDQDEDDYFEAIRVFDDDGNLSEEMIELIVN